MPADEDAEAGALIFQKTAGPSAVQVNATTGAVTWPSPSGTSATVTVTVTDAQGSVAQQTFTLTVNVDTVGGRGRSAVGRFDLASNFTQVNLDTT